MEYTTSELHAKVEMALRKFFHKDRDLLCRDANERSITHKIAEYLQRQFDGLKVDGEYNRHGELPKKDDCNQIVIPDIIVHKRGCDRSNALVVEVKKSNVTDASRDEDKRRLCAFTKPKPEGKYGYRFGLFLEFGVRDQSGLKHAECFQDGKKTPLPCPNCKSLLKSFKPSAINRNTARQS